MRAGAGFTRPLPHTMLRCDFGMQIIFVACQQNERIPIFIRFLTDPPFCLTLVWMSFCGRIVSHNVSIASFITASAQVALLSRSVETSMMQAVF